VLRHEFTHIVTLQQTNFNIPHWFTEGLAVWCEGYPRPAAWNPLLLDYVARGKLAKLDALNQGFMGGGHERQMAYCQSELYVEYMLARGGAESLRKMLAAYAEGLATPQAVRRVFGISIEEFERGYAGHVGKVVTDLKAAKKAGLAALPEREDLERRAAADSEDVAARKRLAALALERRDAVTAIRWANQGLDIDVKDAELHRLLATGLADQRNLAAAIEEYDIAIELDPHHAQQRFALADACLQAGQPAKAQAALEALLKLAPDYPGARMLLDGLKPKHNLDGGKKE
jgi:tetratricopeptide (TPR) repeat protein